MIAPPGCEIRPASGVCGQKYPFLIQNFPFPFNIQAYLTLLHNLSAWQYRIGIKPKCGLEIELRRKVRSSVLPG
jgi:hypothetical protein